MKTANPFIDTLVESQTQFVNNWMESAKKMQNAFSSGNITNEGQSLYKEYFDKQMQVLNNMQANANGMFNSNSGSNNPLEFFRNWFNQQANYAKQMADFGQSISNSMMSYGRPAQDYMSSFGQSNTSFTNMYNSWLNTLNGSYDQMVKSMNNSFGKDIFSGFVQGNQVYSKMQEFFQPMLQAMQKGQFNLEAFKNYFTPDTYTNLTKLMFGSFYNESSMKQIYDQALQQLHNYFVVQNNLSREYFSQIQNLSRELPEMFGNNRATASLKDFYSQINNVFGKTFEPLFKLVNAGKEKENMEALIALMDRMAQYSIKQAELQSFLQTTAQQGIERIARQYSEKYSTPQELTNLPSAQEMYSEWVKVNEQLFTELFASDEFSKVKGEALNLSMDVKQHFEKQFESALSNFPIVFKSDIDELNHTIYELKKQVKDLQNKLAAQTGASIEADEDRSPRKSKK